MNPKIKLTIAGKPVELTVDEAKALHAELAKIFGPVVINHPTFVPYHAPVPQLPHWNPPTFIDPIRPSWSKPSITCLSDGRAA